MNYVNLIIARRFLLENKDKNEYWKENSNLAWLEYAIAIDYMMDVMHCTRLDIVFTIWL